MIYATIKDSEKYYGANKYFKEAFEFISRAVSENLPAGKYEINGKELYASIQEYNTKNAEDCKSEGHRNYIDIQYIVSGVETMQVFDISKATLKSEYNDVKDVEFYEHHLDASVCNVFSGEYAIFFPEDIHRPGMAYGGVNSPVKKIVVKVKA